MTITDMLGQSAILTVLGVGIVFSFLFLVVIVVSQFDRVFNRGRNREQVKLNEPLNQLPSASTSGETDPKIIAAIAAAITEYQKKS